MASINDIYRAWLLSQLGLTESDLSISDLEQLFYINTTGVSENRRFASGAYYFQDANGSNSTVGPVQNALNAFPFPVGKRTSFDRIACAVTTLQAATTVRLGIYDSVNGIPTNLLVDAGTVDSSTVGAKELVINEQLSPGLYYLAACMQGAVLGALLLRGFSANSSMYIGAADPALNGAPAGYVQAGVAGALPDPFFTSFIAAGIYSGASPRIGLRVA